MLFKSIIPQFIINSIKKYFFYFKEYDTYELASHDADGYENDELITHTINRALQFRNDLEIHKKQNSNLLNILAPFHFISKDKPIRVLDFGGGPGTHFMIVKSFFGDRIALEWRVLETPKMVKHAKSNHLETEEIRFYDSKTDCIDKFAPDLIIASASLCYARDPISTLKSLIGLNPLFFYLARTPVAEKKAVLLQRTRISDNGPTFYKADKKLNKRVIKIPVTITDQSSLENAINEKGQILFKVTDQESPYISKGVVYNCYTYLIEVQNT